VTAADAAGNHNEVSHSYYVTQSRDSNPQAWGKAKVSPGDTIRVDTRTGEYQTRV